VVPRAVQYHADACVGIIAVAVAIASEAMMAFISISCWAADHIVALSSHTTIPSGLLACHGDRQIVLTVDHRFALSNPALVSAPSKKLVTALRAPCRGRNGLALDCARKGRERPI
jgi:hypothetical protein